MLLLGGYDGNEQVYTVYQPKVGDNVYRGLNLSGITTVNAIGENTITTDSIPFGKFVTVIGASTDNKFLSSDDGLIWSEGTMPSSNWVDIAYGNGVFTAVSTDNKIAYSTDGINWNIATSTVASGLSKVKFGNGIFTIVGNGGYGYYSTDGINWTQFDTLYTNNFGCLAFGNNKFIAGTTADTTMYIYSSDGMTWQASFTLPRNAMYDIAYGADKFVAFSEYGNYFYSTDGLSWSAVQTQLYYQSCHIDSIVWGDNMFVGIQTSSPYKTAYSSDGITWTVGNSLPTPLTSSSYRKIIYGNGLYIALETIGNNYAYSSDGITWNTGTFPISLSSPSYWGSACFASEPSQPITLTRNSTLDSVFTTIPNEYTNTFPNAKSYLQALNAKQDILTAGNFINLENNEISVEATNVYENSAIAWKDSSNNIVYTVSSPIIGMNTYTSTALENPVIISNIASDNTSIVANNITYYRDLSSDTVFDIVPDDFMITLPSSYALLEAIYDVNHSGYITNTVNNLTNYTLTADLSAVATSGDYNDLLNTPTIITTLVGLSDTDITSPTTGQNLTYDAITQKWKNTSTTATIAWGGITGTLSDQTDLNTALGLKADSADLATVATSGSYTDLSNKPAINDGTLTIQKNGTTIGTFTANQAGNTTANITLDEIIDWGEIGGTLSDQTDLNTALGLKANSADLALVATSGSYNDLLNTPTIPTKTSDITNDSGYITNTVNNLTNYTLTTDLSAVATSGSYTDLINQPTIITTLVGLSDTDITSPTTGQNLTYDAITQKWKNTSTTATIAWGGITGTLSDQTDLNTALGLKADSADLATVATSGSYNDLLNTPTIPTKTSDITNDSGFITNTVNSLTNYTLTADLSAVATSGDYTDLINQPTIITTLVGLSDTDITSPTTGQNLTYDATTQKWKNTSSTATVAWGGITGTLSDQTDLNTALGLKADKDMSNLSSTGKATISDMAYLSNNYIDLTLGASGSTYTAPANGYICICGNFGVPNGFVEIVSSVGRSIASKLASTFTYGSLCGGFVTAGEVCIISYNYSPVSGGDPTFGSFFRFYYAQGEI